MSRQYCKYHPLEPALWYSSSSHIAFCERCVDSSESSAGLAQARCYLSGSDLTYLGGANTAQPFWERVGLLFRYPLHRDGLIMLAIFLLASWAVTSAIGLASLPIMWVCGLLLIASITRYGFLIIEHSAEGRFAPPSMQEALGITGLQVLYQQIAVQLIFVLFVVAVSYLGSDLLDSLANAIIFFVWPASTMILAIEKSIGAAVSPQAIGYLIRSIGWSYLLLYAFILLLWGAVAGLFEVFLNEIPIQFFVPFIVGAVLYFMMVTYHLMGYVIFQYQADIGFVAEDHLARERRRATVDPVDAKIDVLVKEGKYGHAIKVLAQHLRTHSSSVRYHDLLSRLLIATKDTEQALAHGQHFLELLNELGDDARLYFLFCSFKSLDKKFCPDSPQVCFRIATQLYGRGKIKEVCPLLVNLHQRAPNYPEIPDAYLLMAKALIEGYQDRDKAGQYLKFIQMKFPQYHELDEVNDLLASC